nr:hypothetical protein [Nostoc sp. ChiSLP03a]MDZ8215796.1 hypothetical protein [Nostoc sp. ChiSLP03a]
MILINPPSNSATKLTSAIKAIAPEVDSGILAELCRLTRVHNLKWVADKNGNNAYYIMSDLSVAKGLDVKDYAYNWADKTKSTIPVRQDSSEALPGNADLTGSVENNPSKLITSLLQRSSEFLPGKAFKLEGENLANFKKLYQEQNGISLGRVNSLWVGDFLHAYSYLVQGKSETARDFQSLGSKAIQLKVEEEIAQQPIEVVTKHFIYNSGWKKEEYLQRDLCYLASMTPYKLSAEVAVEDYPGSKTETRRFDLVHIQPHKSKGKIVTCYELKKDIITIEDLVMTVHAKRYLQLLKDRYNTNHVNLILVAPFGGSAEALEKCQGVDYEGVEIWTVRKFTQLLLEKAKAYHTKDPYFITSTLLKENETVQKLLEAPQPPKEIEPTKSNVIQMPIKKRIA